MLVSVSRSASDNDAHHQYFDTVDCPSMRDVARIMCGPRHWSPIVWANGKRHGDNYLSCSLLVLDFDDAETSIESFVRTAQEDGIRYILGTTRSHQKEKNGIVCDRFRVAMPFDRPIGSLNAHRQNMRRILNAFRSDQACADGARKYRPCTALHSYGDGNAVPWLPYQPPPPISSGSRVSVSIGLIPQWVLNELAVDSVGGQNKKLFRLAAYLARLGHPEERILQLLRESNSPRESPQEIERVGKQGSRAGRNSR